MFIYVFMIESVLLQVHYHPKFDQTIKILLIVLLIILTIYFY